MTRTSERSAADGFTLVELLIVLTIIGLMSAAVVIAIPDERGSLRAEAERFAARAKAAEERAILSGIPVSVAVGAEGYGFAERRGRDWRPLQPNLVPAGRWADGTTAQASGEAGERIVFDPTGLADPARLVLRRGDERATVEIGADGTIHVGP